MPLEVIQLYVKYRRTPYAEKNPWNLLFSRPTVQNSVFPANFGLKGLFFCSFWCGTRGEPE
jgi:hypothetical protein